MVILYLVIMNLLGFYLMALDKKKAKRQQYRIPEKTLIVTAILGGSIGIWLGMKQWRHKTKHTLFRVGVPLILFGQVVLGIVYFYL
ncbi:DUF1294 domain-containing protein [Alkalihalobacillus sp. LMS39]|uniref:DUF1294 domain-containing protein n=1 Tax=Alkalihalobacillus sp. LMS39 TaxID=2924032 RepID=UPI001FB211CA|nr:DUF1294 domain-containing protein [Alkalihalobacillus sp. LMS39]UOE93394.1 DUF1294 domain-containing protein [Alkalihalobacillus sp. LMS39]